MPILSIVLSLCAAAPTVQIEGGFIIEGLDKHRLGTSVSWLDDITGDGIPEILASTDPLSFGVNSTGGFISVFSGADGSLIRHDAGLPNTLMGQSITRLSDLDGDGLIDYGTRGSAAATGIGWTIFSAASGQILWTRSERHLSDLLYSKAAPIGDINQDGVNDVLVNGNSGPDGQGGSLFQSGHAMILSGADGTLLREHNGTMQSQSFANSISDAGDLDQDGISDYLIGSLYSHNNGIMEVYSGATGNVIWTATSPTFGPLGAFVANLGDINGDGIQDYCGSTNSSFALLFCYSGADGSELWTDTLLRPRVNANGPIHLLADLNGDGIPEIGSQSQGISTPSYLEIISGATGEFLSIMDRSRFGGLPDQYAEDFSTVPDINGDGLTDLIVGRPFFRRDHGIVRNHENGEVFVNYMRPFFTASATTISVSGGPSIAFDLDLPSGDAFKRYTLVASTLGGQKALIDHHFYAPMQRDNFFHRLMNGWLPAMTSGFQGVLDANGDATASMASGTYLTRLSGARLHLSVILYESNLPVSTSMAVTVDVVP